MYTYTGMFQGKSLSITTEISVKSLINSITFLCKLATADDGHTLLSLKSTREAAQQQSLFASAEQEQPTVCTPWHCSLPSPVSVLYRELPYGVTMNNTSQSLKTA